MLYLQPNSYDPAYNIAFEEYVFEHLAEQEDCFILWINQPCIIVGKNQNTLEEINEAYCKEKGIKIARRRSGGGAVYQDAGCLNYTITGRKGREDAFDFNAFSQPVIDCLASLGVTATFTGRNDLQIAGDKFCGNAQLIHGNKLMHHGCMLFDTDLGVLAEALKVQPLKLESKGRKSVRSKVTNIKTHLPNHALDTLAFRDYLHRFVKERFDCREYVLTAAEEAQVKAYQARRNDSWDWVYGENPEFSYKNQAYFAGGFVEVKVLVDNNLIKDIHFYGDFFGKKPVSEVEDALKNCRYDYGEISVCLAKYDINDYFLAIKADEIAKLIVLNS